MIYQFDLSIARSTFETFVVSDPKAWILSAPSSFDILLDGGDFLPWPAGLVGEIDHCCMPNGTMGIRNTAASGTLVIYTSSDYCLDLSGAPGISTIIQGNAQLLAQSMLWQAFVHPNSTNTQDMMYTFGDAYVWGAVAAGVAGQSIDLTSVYYGGLVGSVLASAAALNGGQGSITNRAFMNIPLVLTALTTTATPFTKNAFALQNAGLWSLRQDVLLEVPTIGVAGSMIAMGAGIGFDGNATTAANGLGGCRGIGIAWSNQLANNNWHLISCDGTNVVRDLDTGIPAFSGGTMLHRVLDFQYGAIGGVPVIRALIDGVARATLFDTGMSMAVITGFAAATWYPRVLAQKIQINQNGNTVRMHCGSYTGFQGGRVG